MKTKLLKRLRRKGRNQIRILSVTTERGRVIGMSIAYDEEKYGDLFSYGNTEEEVLKKAERLFIADYIKEKRAKAGRNNEASSEKTIDVLKRLVELKDYKDKYGKDEHYKKEQPVLWNIARETLKACVGNNADLESAKCNKHGVTHCALQMKIEKLEAENKLLAFMVENGLGEQDMLNDITYPHEL